MITSRRPKKTNTTSTKNKGDISQGNQPKEEKKATEGSMVAAQATLLADAKALPEVPTHVPVLGTMNLHTPIPVSDFNFGSESSPFDARPPSDIPVVSFQIESEKSDFDNPPPVETFAVEKSHVKEKGEVKENKIETEDDKVARILAEPDDGIPLDPSITIERILAEDSKEESHVKIDFEPKNVETKKDSDKISYPELNLKETSKPEYISLDNTVLQAKKEVDPKFNPEKLEQEFQNLKEKMESDPLINQEEINKLIDLMEKKPAEFNESIDEWVTLALDKYKPSSNQSNESKLLMDELSKIDTSSFEQNKYIFMKLIHAQGHSGYESAGFALHLAIFNELLWSIDYFKFLHKERVESDFKNLEKANPDSYERKKYSIQSSALNQSLSYLRTLCENNSDKFNYNMRGIIRHLNNLSSDSYKSSSSKVLLIKIQKLLKSKLGSVLTLP